MNLNRRTSTAEHTRIALKCHTALAEMEAGRAGQDEWADLADAINCTEALCSMGKLPAEMMDRVFTAIEGMVQAIESRKAGGAMRMDQNRMDALRKVVSAYDESIGKLAASTLAEAAGRVIIKIAQQREKPDNGVIVIEGMQTDAA